MKLNLNRYEELQELKTDFDTTRNAYADFFEQLNRLIQTTNERIEAEKAETAAKITELEQQAADENRTQTVRDLAAAELEKLKTKTFSATPGERAAFRDLLTRAETATQDLKTLKHQARTASRILLKQIETMTKSVTDYHVDHFPEQLRGFEADFAELCKEV